MVDRPIFVVYNELTKSENEHPKSLQRIYIMNELKNARFWIYVNTGPVKLTLSPGQSLSWGKFNRTDEGWESEERTWEHQGGRIQMAWCYDGVDCDGRLRQGGQRFALVTELKDKDFEGISWPIWVEEEFCQRDYSAEAAGY
jgi:hypothetical protein